MQNLILNRYRPLAEAGRGGYGLVQVAWDTRIQRRVAIKCLPLDGYGTASDPRTPRAIPGLDEARTAAMLSDSNIVGVYDFEVLGDTAFLIMEYVDGITLTELMRECGGALPLDVATCVFASVAHALEVAHDNQVLHLDIKPDNVLINRQGQVKVTDFGLAQLSHEAGFGQAAGGTIGYMPVEQMRLEAPDARTDEWALAALAYEMLTGDNPFRAHDLDAAERAILNAELVIPSAARADVDEEADEAVFGALAIDRADRFESVGLFADALLPHLGDARRGARDLARIVGDACDDGEDEGEGEEAAREAYPRPMRERAGLADRLGGHAQAVLFRAWAVAACGFAAFLSATNISVLHTVAGRETPAFWAVLAVCVLAAAILPSAGALATVLALSAALFANGAYALGAAFLAAGVLWWALCGRKGNAQAVVGVSGIALGAFGFAPLAPLLAGHFLRVPQAIGTAALSAATAFALACSGSMSLTGWNVFLNGALSNHMDANALILLGDVRMWVMAASWAAAAALGALACGRESRPLAVAGQAAAAGVLVLGCAAASAVASGGATWAPDVADFAPAIVAGIAACAFAALGVPERSIRIRPYDDGEDAYDGGVR